MRFGDEVARFHRLSEAELNDADAAGLDHDALAERVLKGWNETRPLIRMGWGKADTFFAVFKA